MRRILPFFYCAFIILSCNNNKNNSIEDDTKTGKPGTTAGVLNCYAFASETDTISLKLVHVGEAITGTLEYKFEGKDKNQGTILGHKHGDVLVAEYRFMSEGVQSVREVAFKKQDSILLEGYGEIYTDNNKSLFKNTDLLHFNAAMPLKEIACQEENK